MYFSLLFVPVCCEYVSESRQFFNMVDAFHMEAQPLFVPALLFASMLNIIKRGRDDSETLC